MAIALAHDVGMYSMANGSPMYICSLDAEGAFDSIPHSILFYKALDVLPDHCWKVMHHWYTNMCVKIKWNKQRSKSIMVQCGTRQGGLTSPFLFNLFYKDLIDTISACDDGVNINNKRYNIFCYADDILLASSTVSGLQRMINTASNYITNHCLRFNPTKTTCLTYGRPSFVTKPMWYLDGVSLEQTESITYLGAELGKAADSVHSEKRIRKAQQAFYLLQNAGVCHNGLNTEASMHIYKLAVRPALTYGCPAIYLSKTAMHKLDKCQAKLLKSILGLYTFCRNTPLLKALNIPKISHTTKSHTIELMRNCMLNNAATREFYSFLRLQPSNMVNKTLFGRASEYCEEFGINLQDYIMKDTYRKTQKQRLKKQEYEQDGLVDSVKFLLSDFNEAKRQSLNALLKPF